MSSLVTIRIWLRPSYPPVAALSRSGQADGLRGVPEFLGGADFAPRRNGGAGDLDEVPLGDPVLRADERVAPGSDRDRGASSASTTADATCSSS